MTIRLLTGDAATVLRTLPDRSVQCCITSPPYLGLRVYLAKDHADKEMEIGAENSPDAYVSALVAVFREVWRVLRDDGCAFVNIGDGYNNFRVSKGPGQAVHGRNKLNGKPAPDSGGRGWVGAKEKDLLMMPARVALGLQSDGWYLRSQMPWLRRNVMPESVEDRAGSAVAQWLRPSPLAGV